MFSLAQIWSSSHAHIFKSALSTVEWQHAIVSFIQLIIQLSLTGEKLCHCLLMVLILGLILQLLSGVLHFLMVEHSWS